MSSERLCELPNGKLWGVASFILGSLFPEDYRDISPASVIIPANQIEGLSDEQIGQCVRSLVKQAKLCVAEECAYWVEASGRTDWDNLLPILEEFEAENEKVAEAASKLREMRDSERRRAEARISAPMKRKEIRANSEKLFVMLGRRDGFKCALCGVGSSDLQIDHITPIAEGGTNDVENLQLLCCPCNGKKSDTFLDNRRGEI